MENQQSIEINTYYLTSNIKKYVDQEKSCSSSIANGQKKVITKLTKNKKVTFEYVLKVD